MISVITGDIINSREVPVQTWMRPLKQVLKQVGDTPGTWEIYRGDSFQAEISDPSEALERAIQLKAALKSIEGIDIRMCIGIGEKIYSADKITESNGPAFVHSGTGFEQLKKNKQSLGIVSPNSEFDEEFNLFLRLILIVMDNWTTRSAEFVHISLEGDLLQKEIAKRLGISQSSVSERSKRSYIREIMEVEKRYRTKVKRVISGE